MQNFVWSLGNTSLTVNSNANNILLIGSKQRRSCIKFLHLLDFSYMFSAVRHKYSGIPYSFRGQHRERRAVRAGDDTAVDSDCRHSEQHEGHRSVAQLGALYQPHWVGCKWTMV